MAPKPIRLKFNMRRIAGFTGNQLKMIAFVLMLCDHIGYILIENGVLYGNNPVYWTMAISMSEGQKWYLLARILRTVGRLSFPIFAYFIAEGVAHSSNVRKYVGRLLMFGIVSEVPFDLAIRNTLFDISYQNVLFTLALGAMSCAAIDRIGNGRFLIKLIATAVFCGLAHYLKSDYGAMGVMMISFMYLVREEKNAVLTVGAVASAAESIDYACVSAFAFVLLYFYNGKRGDFPMKYFFYLGYPLSLLICYALVYFANR